MDSIRVTPITKNMVLTTTPEMAFKHARITGPFIDGEYIIATDALYSAWYAKYVLKGRFLLGEPVINKDPRMSAWYQKEVLDRDWEGEAQLAHKLPTSFGTKKRNNSRSYLQMGI